MTIRTRLSLQFFGITAAILALAFLFIYELFLRHSENEFFDLLESKARMTAEMVLRREDELTSPVFLARTSLPVKENVSIFDSENRRVFALNPSSKGFDQEILDEIRHDGQCRMPIGLRKGFAAEIVSPKGQKFVVVAEGIHDDLKLDQLRNILIGVFAGSIALIALGGWFFASEAMRPVAQIVSEVDSIRPTDMSRRLQKADQKDELSRLAATFNRLLDRLEHAFEMQRGFISNVSHELKNPLAAMSSQLQLVLQKERNSVEYQRVLGSLHEDVRELAETSEKLLQLAKVHSQGAAIPFSSVRLDEILLATRDTLAKTRPDGHVIFEFHDLPETEEMLAVAGNEPLLRTAFLNLFDNACKFSDDRKARVVAHFRADGAHLIEVIDKGLGIPAADLERIFEPFFRSSLNAHIKGSGIGLSLVQSIFELHKSALTVRSEIGKGAVFAVQFPVLDKKST